MTAVPWLRAIATAPLLALLASACMPTATLHRRGAPDLEAMIVANDARHYYVADDEGRLFRVDRRRVYDVDHPGNLLIGIGAPIALTYGTASLVFFDAGHDDNWQRFMAQMFGTVAFAGLALAGLGLAQWTTSAGAAGPEGQLAAPLLPVGLPSPGTAAERVP